MLSAIGSDGRMYYSGAIPSPKSRDYFCPRNNCGQEVSHVAGHLRSLQFRVAEHFRHCSEPGHPVKHFTWQTGNIVSALQDNFRKVPGFDISYDKVFTDPRLKQEYYAELCIKDKVLGNETAVRIESEGFDSEELHAMMRCLSSQKVFTMLLLSAQGKSNSAGRYYRDVAPDELLRNPQRRGVKNIRGNELAIAELLASSAPRMAYFDHDKQEFVVAKLAKYCENRQYDYREQEWVDGYTEFRTKKMPLELCRGRLFVPRYAPLQNGLRVAFPYVLDDEHRAAWGALVRMKEAIDRNDEDEAESAEEEFCIITENLKDDDLVVKKHWRLRELVRAQRPAGNTSE